MSYPINYPTPQGANVQIFRGMNGSTSNHYYLSDWVKPQGASFVWFTLIGAGGGGGGGAYSSLLSNTYYGGGGASGNVTNFMCPAFLLPDILQIQVGNGGNGGATGSINAAAVAGIAGGHTVVFYQQKTGPGYELLRASGGGAGSGADATPGSETNGGSGSGSSADTGGPMTAAGFYNAIAGQSGATGGSGTLSPDGITFLNGGIGCYYPGGVSTGYYGYKASAENGYAQLSPIPLAISGSTPVSSTTKQKASPFGCGGCGGGDLVSGGSSNIYGSRGGDGLAIIVTW